jgi:hypothetical protein
MLRRGVFADNRENEGLENFSALFLMILALAIVLGVLSEMRGVSKLEFRLQPVSQAA